ncbi:Carboxylesterase 5A [Mactra antiquata]
MWRKQIVLLVLGIFLSSSLCIAVRTPVTVQTKVGSIKGYQENVNIDGKEKTISKFLGIPFAESTAGVNRFQKPVPKAKFANTFDAREVGYTCYQSTTKTAEAIENMYGLKTGFSDDCLSLNIYVPGDATTGSPKSVMIWIYGGAFITGASALYKATGLTLFGDVIVVTVNYRLGMFGFLRDSEDHFPGNQGLWDQQLAIKWVYDHIESFHGLKTNITIFGQSAGSASVLFQAMYPGNRGLFQRVIAESGTPFAKWAVVNESISDQYIADKGCTVWLLGCC